jgi:hypothetical protein
VNTLKTAVVVVVLLAMAYGGWMLLNGRWKLITTKDGSDLLGEDSSEAPAWTGGVPRVEIEAPSVDAVGESEFGPQGFRDDTSPTGSIHGGQPSGNLPPDSPGSYRKSFPGPGILPQAGPPPLDELSPESLAIVNGAGGHGRVAPAGGVEPEVYSSPVTPSRAFAAVWRSSLQQIEDEQFKEALYGLTAWLGSPDLTREESEALQHLLDQLAGTVIYSTEHLMEPAYDVRRGERLQDIAAQYHVPWQLLANINGVENPDVLLPSQRLKVIEGPFAARVDLDSRQIVLFLRGYYAGRLPFMPGRDQSPRPGTYYVVSKKVDRIWTDENGHAVPAGHPDNPYGKYWIDLGAGHCIHGSTPAGEDRGCVSVSPGDAQNLYCILASGSQVKIR